MEKLSMLVGVLLVIDILLCIPCLNCDYYTLLHTLVVGHVWDMSFQPDQIAILREIYICLLYSTPHGCSKKASDCNNQKEKRLI